MSIYSTAVLIAATFVVGTVAQERPPQAAPQVLPTTAGVVVVGLGYDPVTREVKIQFRNTSTRQITAFGWTVRFLRPSGTPLEHYEVIDLLPLFALQAANANLKSPTDQVSFNPGDTYSARWHTPDGWGTLAPDSIRCELSSLIIYGDSTAIGEAGMIEQVFASRREQVAAYADFVTQIKGVPRDAQSGVRLAELQRADNLVKASAGRRAQRTARLMGQAVFLFQRGGWNHVDEFVRVYQTRASLISQQSTRKER